MKMNKAYGITASKFSELIDKINDFAAKNNVFSTQFLEPDRNTFYCVVWYQSQEQEKARQDTPQPQIEASKTVNPITPGQYKALCLMSKDLEGEEYLKSKGIKSEKDIEKLSKKEAWQIMHDRGTN